MSTSPPDAQRRNVAPDATSRATTWNAHSGALDVLSDGLVPIDQTQVPPFIWETKGILAFEWLQPQPLALVRIYVGEIGNNYQVRTYLGGRLDPTGALRDPEGELTAFIEENSRVTNQWLEIELPTGVLADNIEIWTLGPTVFYEIEIYRREADNSLVRALPWAQLKTQPNVE